MCEEHPRVVLASRGHGPRLVGQRDARRLDHLDECVVELRRGDCEVAEGLHSVLGVCGRAEVDADRHPVGLRNLDGLHDERRDVSLANVLRDVEVEVLHAAAYGELLAPVGDGEGRCVVDLCQGYVCAAEEVEANVYIGPNACEQDTSGTFAGMYRLYVAYP
ncbi:hypothetical protein C5B85_00905 [Pseudoclavibacter sp. AY1F1]|uniref:hypothetical protein n=1 Tax=Pseudoclavibacter sp. AY1F1 TaxID=2080583 RepID=UPI000CE7FBDE|nr:hypothetical protein [Pseudoclavibacter sp. AY1F1]PPF46878.1 hypothetical protein C5B85_00905 [Pseudoclavibacter sp. AY1F1]